MTVVVGGPAPVKVCPSCGAKGEYAGFLRACPSCRKAAA